MQRESASVDQSPLFSLLVFCKLKKHHEDGRTDVYCSMRTTHRLMACALTVGLLLVLTLGVSAYNENFKKEMKTGEIQCDTDEDCGVHGSCVSKSADLLSAKHCECIPPYINQIYGKSELPCSYKGFISEDIFWLSFFFGWLGIDWFILAGGTNCAFIWVGFAKLLSFGGFGIWWAADWVRLWERQFHDGNGMPLFQIDSST